LCHVVPFCAVPIIFVAAARSLAPAHPHSVMADREEAEEAEQLASAANARTKLLLPGAREGRCCRRCTRWRGKDAALA
jgi:hypothetical protein